MHVSATHRVYIYIYIYVLQEEAVSDLVQRIIDTVGLEGDTSDYIIIDTAEEGELYTDTCTSYCMQSGLNIII